MDEAAERGLGSGQRTVRNAPVSLWHGVSTHSRSSDVSLSSTDRRGVRRRAVQAGSSLGVGEHVGRSPTALHEEHYSSSVCWRIKNKVPSGSSSLLRQTDSRGGPLQREAIFSADRSAVGL
ncbi:hypothetical protein Q8A67_019717 [Cirrhinus molitorella]|uniref:Uncharacterized protein n=1 Tax=Cirrhinus molitorella TaxID=172907 RepID=A0AA88PM36_9TELE|nr:hypothetical protein Q8A67_019717 [Cirrhinus molitorella]